jgi:hypothetical protein
MQSRHVHNLTSVTLGNEPASGSNLGYRGGSGYMAVPNGPLPELAFAEHYFSTSAEKRALPGTGNCKSRRSEYG